MRRTGRAVAGSLIVCCAIVSTVRAVAAPSAPAKGLPPDQPGAERAKLLESLRTSCRGFSEDQWEQADKCRRAWFSAHEEAIWRLDLNPHRRPIPPPSA